MGESPGDLRSLPGIYENISTEFSSLILIEQQTGSDKAQETASQGKEAESMTIKKKGEKTPFEKFDVNTFNFFFLCNL